MCSDCGLQWGKVFQEHKDIVIQNSDYFPQKYLHYFESTSIGDISTYPPYVDFFNALGGLKDKEKLNILDIGCGSGIFIGECLRRGHDAQGIEANEQMRKHMASNVVAQCHFGLAQDISSLMPSQEKKYDVITFWDSFEHIESSFEILDALRERLTDDGVIYARVNNNRDIYNYLSKFLLNVIPPLGRNIFKKCFGFPYHCWNFSELGMESLLEQHGFKIVKKVVGETPASRLTKNAILVSLIRSAYFANRLIKGGKIGNYYIKKTPEG